MVRRLEPARTLIVDDEGPIQLLLSRYLETDGHQCVTASSAEEAQELLKGNEFHLVLSDINMPGISGIDLLKEIKTDYPDIAVLMVTAVDDRKLAGHALELGAYGYLIKPFTMSEVLINVANALERRRLTLLSQNYERELEKEVKERTREVEEKALKIKDREEEIVLRLLSSMGIRDDETGAHASRIGLYSAAMAEELGWDDDNVNSLRLAAPMHDLGKIGIDDSILRKAGKLTPEEFEIMKQHTIIGAKILEGSEVQLLQLASEIALSHHEKWDGSGYPYGLKENDIPQSGRIVAIADVYDALVHERVYKPAFPEEKAIALMEQGSGKHFDPKALQVFFDLLPVMRRIRKDVRD